MYATHCLPHHRFQPPRATVNSNTFRIAFAASLVFAAVTGSAGAQAKKAAKKTSAPASSSRTVSVLVLPVDSTPGDSIRTIVQRDLSNGDRVTTAFIDPSTALRAAPIGRDTIDVALLAPAKAANIVRLMRVPAGLTVTLRDGATGIVRQTGNFLLPLVAEAHPEFIRDSLARDLAAKASDASAQIARDSVTRDSLLRLNAAPPPKKKQNTKERAAAKVLAASRDSMVKEIEARRIVIFAKAKHDTVARDSVLPLLLAADSANHFRSSRDQRLAIHIVSDSVEKWLTGTRGIAATRIAYVAGKNLHVVDSDGAVDEIIRTPGAAMSPSWHPQGKSIVYSDFTDYGTQIAEVDLPNETVRLLAATARGLNITPVYTPDGRNLVFGTGGEKPADLVLYELGSTFKPKPLSDGRYENSSPSFNPDGTKMVFMSPRPALTPQIYVMNSDGTGVKLLTPFAKGKRSYRTGPDWSPTGDAVAYEQQNGDFQVWMINLKSGAMTQLTRFKENEDPSWAPDGRHMAITSTRGGTREIWVLDVKTSKYRQITHVNGARLASWSPPLHLLP